ncbi:MAG: hypothetical protein HY883_06050, partial [Deltaproteobacteria bacterium]|nr:hypothetical protein [Deltaproteobacteria bacterium]
MVIPVLHVIHLLTVIIWIGGLAFITMLVLPMVVGMQDALQKVLFFQRIEHRFAPAARIYNAIVVITGLLLMFLGGWHTALFTRQGVPLLIMLIIGIFWTVMLFGLEPRIIKKMLGRLAKSGEKMEIETVFKRLNRMHWILLVVSLAAA